MDRILVALGTLLAAVAVGAGASIARAPDGPRSPAGAPPPRNAPAVPPPAGAATPGTPPAPPSSSVAPPAGTATVEWSMLTSYEYQPGLEHLPEAVRALDGKSVVMHGFLMPLYEFDDIHEFVLVPNHMSCCFGMPAGINGQVQVKLDMKRGLPNTNEPLEVTGTFHAVETKEQGFVLSIFRIDGAQARVVGY